MSVFTLIWLGTVIWAFTKSNIKYMFSVTLLFMTFQCANVISFDSLGVGPQLMTSAVFVVKTILSNKGKIYFSKNNYFILIIVVVLLASVLNSLVWNDALSDNFLRFLQLAIYVICFVAILLNGKRVKKGELYQVVRKITIFLLTIGIIQLLTTMDILPLRPVLKQLIYNDNSDTVYFNSSNYSRLLSTFMEPSYFAGLLVGAFYYFLSLKDKWKENYLLMAFIFLEMILTMSSTAYGAFVIVGVVFILFQDNVDIKFKIAIFCLAVIGFAVMYFGFYDILDAVIFSKTDTGSYRTRTRYNNEAISAYLDSVWYGIGYKNIRGSSIIYSLLGETGRFGLTAYVLFNLILISPIMRIFSNKKYNSEHIGTAFAVLSIVICQIIACPDLDLCTYWFWLYVFAASLKESRMQSISFNGANGELAETRKM
ncbi:MAG: hypothetical protein HFG49_11810 [Lachnospiraceae bacterium]|nr:hypothetical protein [Lachnospiraceae bacterium]